MRWPVAVACLSLSLGAAHAASVNDLVGNTAYDLKGERIGAIEELVLDVREGRVLYVVVDGPQRYETYPIRALREDAHVDTSAAGRVARPDSENEVRFRRAGRLIGEHVSAPGGSRFGIIADIEFDPASGRVDEVLVLTDRGTVGLPASVLAHGRFPPLPRWQVEQPGSTTGNKGVIQAPPSDERRSYGYQW